MSTARRLGRAVKGTLLGGALGSLCACPDGLLLGWIFAPTPTGVVRWAGAFVLGGALLGGLLGLLGGRMVLRPPEAERNEER
jgi:hypothetical protein